MAEIARPVIQLLGFARVLLKAGEKRSITFKVHTDRLAYIGSDYTRIVDAGKVTLSVGSSRSNLFFSQDIELVGPTRQVPFDRVLRTPVLIK